MYEAKNRKLAISRNRVREQLLVCNLRALKSRQKTHFNWHCHCQEEADKEERKQQEEESLRKEELDR